jgi:hypothetical protein
MMKLLWRSKAGSMFIRDGTREDSRSDVPVFSPYTAEGVA